MSMKGKLKVVRGTATVTITGPIGSMLPVMKYLDKNKKIKAIKPTCGSYIGIATTCNPQNK